MKIDLDETIAALASSPGAAARGILRVSGPDSLSLFEGWFQQLTRGTGTSPDAWPPSRPSRVSGMLPTSATDASDNGPTEIPVDLYVWPTSRSFVGQPTVEVHLTGAPALTDMLLTEIYSRGARPAQPGEFTLRAFLGGKLDLVQAEAVLGVIDASDSRELELALSQLGGGLSGRLRRLRVQLLETLADLEAGLDFVDEDIEFVSRDEIRRQLESAESLLQELAADAQMRLQIVDVPRIVLTGMPNAGKSTLFNALVREQAALVSESAGTTRDYLSARVETEGLAFELVDTAGWETTSGRIAEAAQTLRREQIEQADLILLCEPAGCSPRSASGPAEHGDQTLRNELLASGRPLLRVMTKFDLASPTDFSAEDDVVAVSALTNARLDDLLQAIRSRFCQAGQIRRQFIGMTAARCRESLRAALVSLNRAMELIRVGAGDELLSIEIRDGLEQIGEIVGAVYTDDLLDRVFSKFCIGK